MKMKKWLCFLTGLLVILGLLLSACAAPTPAPEEPTAVPEEPEEEEAPQ